ncbi:hypothetical protein ACLOJK_041718 [Asimina triloba]
MTCCAGRDGCDRPDVVMLISRCCQMDVEAAVDLLDRVGLLGSWLDALLLVGFGLQEELPMGCRSRLEGTLPRPSPAAGTPSIEDGYAALMISGGPWLEMD